MALENATQSTPARKTDPDSSWQPDGYAFISESRDCNINPIRPFRQDVYLAPPYPVPERKNSLLVI